MSIHVSNVRKDTTSLKERAINILTEIEPLPQLTAILPFNSSSINVTKFGCCCVCL